MASKDTWNLSSLFNSNTSSAIDQNQQEAESAVQTFVSQWQKRADFLTTPSVLLQALTEYEDLMRHYGTNAKVWYYFELRSAQDQANAEVKGQFAAADEVATKLQNRLQFFTLSISNMDLAQQQKMLADDSLSKYKHFLERLFAEKQFLLSDKEEAILNLVSQPAYGSWVRMTSTFLAQESPTTLDQDGQERPKTLVEIMSLANHRDKSVRDKAAEHIHQIMAKYAPVATEEMNAILTHKKLTDDLRGFGRPDQARHISDDIDSDMVDAMVNAVAGRNDIANRYYQLKAKLLGVPKLAYHERNVEIGDINQEYSFEEAYALVSRVFSSLDPQFADILQSFKNQGQFDIFPRPGKVGGAFCAAALISLPTYVLLNHTNRLQDVLTLAHEMGHGINNELMRANLHALDFGTPLSTAEVASTFMEDFVLEELLNGADDQTRLQLLMVKLNDDISSIFRQVAAYQFEQELHKTHRQKGYIDQASIGQLFQTHMAEYMGSAVEQSAGSQHWWVYWSHIRNFFYVYSYASGLLISKSLQAKVHQDPSAISSVKQFLSAGQSDSPKNIFLQLGIDLDQAEFWQLGLNQIDQLLQKTEELAAQLGYPHPVAN